MKPLKWRYRPGPEEQIHDLPEQGMTFLVGERGDCKMELRKRDIRIEQQTDSEEVRQSNQKK